MGKFLFAAAAAAAVVGFLAVVSLLFHDCFSPFDNCCLTFSPRCAAEVDCCSCLFFAITAFVVGDVVVIVAVVVERNVLFM